MSRVVDARVGVGESTLKATEEETSTCGPWLGLGNSTFTDVEGVEA